DYRGGRDWSPRREAAGVSRSSVEPQLRVARKGLDADRTAAGPVAVFEAGAGSVALAHHVGARGLDVAAERAGFDAGRGVAGKSQPDVSADGFEAEATAIGDAGADPGVAGHGACLEPRQPLAPGVDVDVARHGLRVDAAGDAAAQRHLAADAFDADVVAVEGQPGVPADAFDVGLAWRADRDHVAAHAVDFQLVAGHALDVDAGRDRFHV